MKYVLNKSQINAIYRYYCDNHVVINSGRQFGKTTALIGIFDYWLNNQMKENDVCVIIVKSYSQIRYIKQQLFNLCSIIDYGGYYKSVYNMKYNVVFYVGIESYFRNLYNGNLIGLKDKITLIIGDECYISQDMCKNTACAFTQRIEFNKLEISDEMKKRIDEIKNCMSKEQFNLEYGQYLK
jgi:hypothetical protein